MHIINMDEIYDLMDTVLEYRNDQRKLWSEVYCSLKSISIGTVPPLDASYVEEKVSDLSSKVATLAPLKEVNHNNLDDVRRELVEQKITLNFLHKKHNSSRKKNPAVP